MIVENDVRRPLPLPSASLNENVGGSHRISLNVSASNLSKLMGNGNQKQGGDSDDNAHVAGTGTDKTTAAPPALVPQDNADTQKREMERRAASAATPTTSSNLNPGDVRFLIATQWFNLWRAYANGESKTSPPIDIDQASLLESASADDPYEEPVLRPGLRADEDYVLLTKPQWEYIARIYSSNVALQRVVVDGKPAPFVEVYPLSLLVTYNNDQPHEFRVSRSERVADVARKVAGDLAIHLDGRAPILTVAGSAQQLVPNRTLGEQDVADGAPLVLSLPNTALQTPTTPLHRNSKSTPSILLAAAAAEADGDDDDNAATTPPSVGRAAAAAQTSPSTPAAGSSYSPLKSTSLMPRVASASTIGEDMTYDSPSGKPGLVGLQNIGNTCFMNSALQCVAHTPSLMTYFHDRKHLEELNRDNPLGMGGELAESFGRLVQTLWRPKLASLCPRSFKEKIGRFAPRFLGYQQQDSQEFLAFLLDGLHEDLNRVKSKPYTEVKDSDGRPDSVVCAEHWDLHRRRNESVVVDAFQGQYRSELTCPRCGYQSVTFDPFMYLTVPMPTPETQRFAEVLLCDSIFGRHRIQRLRPLSLGKNGKVGELRQGVLHMAKRAVLAGEVAAASAAPAAPAAAAIPHAEELLSEHLLFAELSGGRIARILEDDGERVPEHKPSASTTGTPAECIVCYRLPSAAAAKAARALLSKSDASAMKVEEGDDREGLPGIELALVHHRRRARRSMLSISSETSFALFGVPQLVVASPVTFQPGDKVELLDNVSAEKLAAKVTGLPLRHAASAGLARALAPYSNEDSDGTSDAPFELARCDAKGLGTHSLDDSGSDGSRSASGGLVETAGDLLSSAFGCAGRPSAVPEPSTSTPVASPAIVGWQCGGGEVAEAPASPTAAAAAAAAAASNEAAASAPSEEDATMTEPGDDDGDDDTELLDDAGTRLIPGLAAFGCASPMLLALTWSASLAGEAPAPLPSMPKGAFDASAIDDAHAPPDSEARIDSTSGGSKSPTSSLGLGDCMELLSRPEQLEEGEEWYCKRCKEHITAYKKLDLYELPEVLVIHLKRFSSTGRFWRDKLDTKCNFPLRGLNLRRHLFVNASPRNDATKAPVYDLFAVSNHYGGMGGGHYTAYATLGGDDEWHTFDDSHVTAIGDAPEKKVVSPAAYVLFYARRQGPNDPNVVGGKSAAAMETDD